MTDKHLQYDPEGLFPAEMSFDTPPQAGMDEDQPYSLHIHGLTEAQFQTLQSGVFQALQPGGASKLNRLMGKMTIVCFLMIIIAGTIWSVAQILSALPGR